MPKPFLLIDFLPKAGMTYLAVGRVHKRQQRDRVVYDAFKAKGIITGLSNAEIKDAKMKIQNCIKGTFVLAVLEKMLRQLKTGTTDQDGFYSFFSELKEAEAYAEHMPKPAFIEFFFRLVEARVAYKRNPFNSVQEVCELADIIDGFLEQIGDDWARLAAGFEFFAQQGGLDKDEGLGTDDKGQEDQPMTDFGSLGAALESVAEGAYEGAEGTTPMDLD
ncbi:hypothetical protein F4779DRAFT_621891 [Xylariaceae sp. FL0662B]|nr:hypothetical protein F4779DRAFT_621891 [Xylariaceae sp. FL0662B]